MSYFILQGVTPLDDDDGYYDVQDGIDVGGVRSWALGEPIAAPLPGPIVVPIVPVGGFRGAPGDLLDGYLCLMSVRLVAALLAAGVDNLQTSDSLLVDETNGRSFPYHAVNVLGLAAAADLEASTWTNLDGPAVFDSFIPDLVLDTSRAAGRRMFRLAESTGTLVVHASVKERLEADDFTLRFDPVS